MKRKYENSFKEEAVRLVREEGRTMKEVAKSLEIRADMISRWKRKEEAMQKEKQEIRTDVMQGERGQTVSQLIQQIRRKSSHRFSAEDKIRIVIEGLKREIAVSDLCRREGISTAIYYSWTKDFMEGGKGRLKGDNLRQASKQEVESLRKENERLKTIVGEEMLEITLLKKSLVN